ncbi:MAG: YCF48-related protein [Cyclobacteriaceae bacterium]
MKQVYFLLLFCGATIAANTQSINWIKKGTGPYGLNKLEASTYANPDKLWGVGNNGFVISSSDNGFTWTESIVETNDDLIDLAMVKSSNPRNGYAVSKQGTAYYTQDFAESWGSVSINAASYEEPVAFHGIEYIHRNFATADQQLIAIGEGATKGLLLIDNGQFGCGNCDQELTVFKELTDIPRDIFFLTYYDNSAGSIVNLAYIVGDNGFAAYSDDYFETYTLLPNLGATENLTSVVFKDVNTGYIGAEGALYYTNNGGATWTKQDNSPWNAVAITDIRYINSLAYATAVSINNPSATFYVELVPNSTDFDFSINYLNEAGLNQLSERYVGIYPSSDGQNFVLISENGVIAESTDFGSNWTVQNTDIPSPNALDVTGSRIYATFGFSNAGSAYSEDDGETWTAISFSGSSVDYPLESIAMRYTGDAYVGLSATSLEPTTYGESEVDFWAPSNVYNSENDGLIRDIDLDSAGNIWFVGGSVYKASSSNYTSQTRITTPGYEIGFNGDEEYAVDFTNDQIGYITGPNDFIYKTTDGGQTWSNLTSGTTDKDFREIAFISNDDGFVLFDDSTNEYLYTDDGGTTWQTGVLPAITTWKKILFTSQTNGYVSGDDGYLAKTTNAGASWSLVDLGVDKDIIDISFNEGKLYGVVGGGFIFSVIDKQSQTITFEPIADKSTGEDSFPLEAFSSSELEVAYSSSDLEVITINGSTATIVGIGTATITASQPGNENFEAAPDVEQVVNVTGPTLFIWDGSSWDQGTPPGIDDDVQINAAFNTQNHGIFKANSLEVSSGAYLWISNGYTLEVAGDIVVNGDMMVPFGASLITYEGNNIADDIYFSRNTRYSDGKYSFVGSPVEQNSETTASDLGMHIYTYDEAVSDLETSLSRWIAAAESDQLIPGQGYTQANQKLIDFVGKPNAGTIIYSGSYENDGWHLVSNPYPAAIFLDDFLDANTNTTDAIYIWDDNGSDTGRGSSNDYIVANKTAATDISGTNNESRWNEHIGSSQGFFVQLDGAPGNITFTEDMRVHGNNADGNFFRTAKSEKSIVRLNLTHEEGLIRQAVIGWNENIPNTKLAEGYDAQVFSATADYLIYTTKANTPLAIQTVNSEIVEIPIGFNVAEAGQYALEFELENVMGELYLYDTERDQEVSLSGGSYSFHSGAGQIQDRFQLRTASKVLALAETNVKFYAHGKTLNIKTTRAQPISYRLYDLSGHQVHLVEVTGSAAIDLSKLANGVYIVSDGIESRKVILK